MFAKKVNEGGINEAHWTNRRSNKRDAIQYLLKLFENIVLRLLQWRFKHSLISNLLGLKTLEKVEIDKLIDWLIVEMFCLPKVYSQ